MKCNVVFGYLINIFPVGEIKGNTKVSPLAFFAVLLALIIVWSMSI
mgnify:CR=1 FL=1